MVQTSFHEVRFPKRIAFGAAIIPERRTEIVTLGSGFEERNSRWAHARRQYDAGQGVRTVNDIHAIIDFFEERRGALYGFRFSDRVDFKSCAPLNVISANDQKIGEGDGITKSYQLKKIYGHMHQPYERIISKPVSETVLIAVNGLELHQGDDFSVEAKTGEIIFLKAPLQGETITAGYEFDVPVRFATDRLEINLSNFDAGDIPSIPLIEVRV